MNRATALALSVICHPVFINALSLAALFFLYPALRFGIHPALKLFYWSVVFVSTAVLPMAWVGLSRLMGRISSIMLHDRDDRTVPYMLTAGLYLLDFYLAGQWGAAPLFRIYLLACSSIVVSVLLINLYTKISIHAASMGALTGILFSSANQNLYDMRWPIMAVLLMSGLVMTARLKLDAHKPFQLYLGFVLGIGLMYIYLNMF